MYRYVSQSSQITLSVHRAKSGFRNFLAKDVVANIVLEAEGFKVKGDKSTHIYSGTCCLLYASFFH